MMNAVLCSAQVSLVRVSGLPSILSPTTQHPPAVALAHNPSARRACCGPLPAHTSFGMYDRRLRTSPTGCRLARMPGRIEFVILRTARLPPVLPTPPHGNAVAFSSRPEYAYLERTCTSDQTRSQTVHTIQLVWMVSQAGRLRASSPQPPVFPSPRPLPTAAAEAKGGLFLAFAVSLSASFTRRTRRRGSGPCAKVALPN
jgi:hypothetical protein